MQVADDVCPQALTISLRKKGGLVLCGIAACICAVALRLALPVGVRTYYSIGPLPIFVALSFFALFRKARLCDDGLRRGEKIATFALCLLFSCCFVIGGQLCEGINRVRPSSLLTFLGVIINAVPLYSGLVILWNYLDSKSASAPSRQRSQQWRAKQAILLFVLLFSCWLPILLAVYPGQFAGDVGSLYLGEWNQWESGELNNHHPVLHTILMCSIIELGKAISSFNFGVFLFSLFQGGSCAAIFTYILFWLKKHGCPRWLIVASAIYFCVGPSVSWFVFFSNCDTLFSALALWFGLQLYNTVTLDASCTQARGKKVLLTLLGCFVSGLLFCCMRPNGMYALVASAPFLVLLSARGETRKRLVASLVSILFVFWIWMNPLSGALGVQDSKLQQLNVFSLPIQQMSYVYEYGDIDEDEVLALEKDGYNANNSYKQDLADFARGSFSDMSSLNILKNYVKIGMKHPGAYAKAFILQTSYAWNPYGYMRSVSGSCPISLDYSLDAVYDGREKPQIRWFSLGASDPATHDSKVPMLYRAMTDISSNLIMQNIPLLSMLVSLPCYIAALLLALLRSAIRKDRGAIAILVLLFFLTASAFVGPGIIIRYYIYLLFGLPLIIFFLLRPRPSFQR